MGKTWKDNRYDTKEKQKRNYKKPKHDLENWDSTRKMSLIQEEVKQIEKRETHGIVILDQTSDSRENARQRKMFKEFQNLSTGGRFPRNLDFIVDTLHFVPSIESCPIQAIDLLTYVHYRRKVTRYPEKTEALVLEHIWNVIEKRLGANRTV